MAGSVTWSITRFPTNDSPRCTTHSVPHEIETPADGDHGQDGGGIGRAGIVRFTTTYTSPGWDAPELSRSSLRFLDPDALSSFLSDAGLETEVRFGDWAGGPLTDTSPEIITVARRPESRPVRA